jgi:lipopolysaccharide export system permease protein
VKILHKYVLKEHVGPLTFAMTALTSLLLLQYIAKRFGDLVGKGLPWSVIGEFLGLSIPLTVALSMPMAVLVATLYAFSQLAAENEITAMKAGGVSLRSVVTPVLLAAVGVTLFMVAFNDQVLPRANHRLRTLQGDIAQKKPTFGLREQVINEVSPGKLYLRAGHLSKTSNKMREVMIYDVSDATRRRTVYADSGNMVLSPNHSDLQLTLYSGTVQDVPTSSPDQLQRMYFDTELIRVKNVGNEFQKTTNDSFKGEREMSVCEMEKNAAVARRTLAAARKDFLRKLALAKRRKVKVGKDVLQTNVNDPVSIGLGRVYCALLTQLGVKTLGAQTPGQPVPVQPRVAQATQAQATQAQATQAQATQGQATPSRPAPRQPRSGPHRPKTLGTGAVQPGHVARPATSAAQPLTPALPDARTQIINDATLPSELDGLRLRVEDARRTENGYEVEIQKKFALAAACFVFVLLGAPIALRFPRGGVGLTIGVSLIVFSLYYVGLIAGESLARRGFVPPFISMWGANLIFTALALVLLSRMGKENTSGHGGDLREIARSVRSRIRRARGRRMRAVASPRPSAS